jgi:hypothetical protein
VERDVKFGAERKNGGKHVQIKGKFFGIRKLPMKKPIKTGNYEWSYMQKEAS